MELVPKDVSYEVESTEDVKKGVLDADYKGKFVKIVVYKEAKGNKIVGKEFIENKDDQEKK